MSLANSVAPHDNHRTTARIALITVTVADRQLHNVRADGVRAVVPVEGDALVPQAGGRHVHSPRRGTGRLLAGRAILAAAAAACAL